mmetsp:Transcript_13560/g.33233  ORF Transcript_13560/g.33233 Transcript_13560/m.33233 type:complete len:200 (-) Transcript_13560:748-1347(-)
MPVLYLLQPLLQGFTTLNDLILKLFGLDRLEDRLKDHELVRIPQPRVEDPVALRRGEVLAVIEAARLHLLREGHHVRRHLEVPPLVGPCRASRAEASLHFVDDEDHAVLEAHGTQLAEEMRRGPEVPPLGQDRLHNEGCDWLPADSSLGDYAFRCCKAPLLLFGVVIAILLKRVLRLREGCGGPVECWDVDLVEGLRSR